MRHIITHIQMLRSVMAINVICRVITPVNIEYGILSQTVLQIRYRSI